MISTVNMVQIFWQMGPNIKYKPSTNKAWLVWNSSFSAPPQKAILNSTSRVFATSQKLDSQYIYHASFENSGIDEDLNWEITIYVHHTDFFSSMRKPEVKHDLPTWLMSIIVACKKIMNLELFCIQQITQWIMKTTNFMDVNQIKV